MRENMPDIVTNKVRLTLKNDDYNFFEDYDKAIRDIVDNYFEIRFDSFNENDNNLYPQFDFNKLIKMPDDVFIGHLTVSLREEHNNNWYDWRVKNWGCKWNAKESSIGFDEDKHIFELKFETPNTPPLKVIKKFYSLFEDKVNIEWHIRTENDETFNIGDMLKSKKFVMNKAMKQIKEDNENTTWNVIKRLSETKKISEIAIVKDEQGNKLSDKEVEEKLDDISVQEIFDNFVVVSDLIPHDVDVKEGVKENAIIN
tara:strand:+ start:1200 stop:1967 length:768 start_codon:yes stop_codon:yes gene_type:complete